MTEIPSPQSPFLEVGTEVSAKFKGAFCEAKVKHVKCALKCKITASSGNTLSVDYGDIKSGNLAVGEKVKVKLSNGVECNGQIARLTDTSLYTVVFDDGDERTLRRSALCLKGAKHFNTEETLESLPLTDPEYFGTPVYPSQAGKGRKRRITPLTEESDDNAAPDDTPDPSIWKVGDLVCVERRNCFPALVVTPDDADKSLDADNHAMVRSFKDYKFYSIPQRDLKAYDPQSQTQTSASVQAIKRVESYLADGTLPWAEKRKQAMKRKQDEPPPMKRSLSSDVDEEREALRTLISQNCESSSSVDKSLKISCNNFDVDLFNLRKTVLSLGGYETVTSDVKWKTVCEKMDLTSFHMLSVINQLKSLYRKFLLHIESIPSEPPKKQPRVERPKSLNIKKEMCNSLSSKSSEDTPRAEEPSKETNSQEPLFNIGDNVSVKYGEGSSFYPAKIISTEVQDGTRKYLIHYVGWNSRYDEWITTEKIRFFDRKRKSQRLAQRIPALDKKEPESTEEVARADRVKSELNLDVTEDSTKTRSRPKSNGVSQKSRHSIGLPVKKTRRSSTDQFELKKAESEDSMSTDDLSVNSLNGFDVGRRTRRKTTSSTTNSANQIKQERSPVNQEAESTSEIKTENKDALDIQISETNEPECLSTLEYSEAAEKENLVLEEELPHTVDSAGSDDTIDMNRENNNDGMFEESVEEKKPLGTIADDLNVIMSSDALTALTPSVEQQDVPVVNKPCLSPRDKTRRPRRKKRDSTNPSEIPDGRKQRYRRQTRKGQMRHGFLISDESDSEQKAAPPPNTGKWNFALQLENIEKFEDRIAFIYDKIKEMRTAYSKLRKELGKLDRLKKRIRKKKHEREKCEENTKLCDSANKSETVKSE